MANKRYTIIQAAHELPNLLHFVEEGQAIELTRNGKPIAVLVSVAEYRSMPSSQAGDFWQALQQFRQQYAADLPALDEVFTDLRDPHPGRDGAW
jgi:PTS system cellobiose-specific IIB component